MPAQHLPHHMPHIPWADNANRLQLTTPLLEDLPQWRKDTQRPEIGHRFYRLTQMQEKLYTDFWILRISKPLGLDTP
jgi:hypothetical protein